MKKTLNKIIPLLILTGAMSACSSYSAKPGKKENLVGTYELSVYEMKHDDSNSEEKPYDRKAEIGAAAYFSIDNDGYGYYGYKDNDTPTRVDQVFSTFTMDDDKPELVKAINMTDGVTHKYADEQFVGCLDESPMGFRDELLKKTLSYTLHSGHMIGLPERKIRYQHVVYKRVSKEASLAKVNELLKTNVSFSKPYELKALKGYLVYRCNINEGADYPADGKGLYEYAVLDTNSYSNGKFTVHYSLKSAPGAQTVEVPVTITEKGYSHDIKFMERNFHCGSYSGLGSSYGTLQSDYEADSPINSESFTIWWGNELSLEEVIANETAWTNGSY